MFFFDMPNVPDQYLPVLVAESRQVATSSASKDLTFGVCLPVPNIPGHAIGREHEISPVATARHFLWSFDDYFKQMPDAQRRAALDLLETSAKVTILQQPKHGTLTETAKPAFRDPINGLFYNPKLGYMGKDQVILLVAMGEYKISIIYNLYPVDSAPDGPETLKRVCGKRGVYYRISTAGEQLAT